MIRVKNIIVITLFLFIGTAVCYAETLPDISMGIESYQLGKIEECISRMKAIVKDDPTSVLGYYYLAMAYTKTGQELLAIQNYNKVINLNSDATLTKMARLGKSKINNSTQIETQLKDITEDIKETIEEEYNPIMEDSCSGKSVNTSTKETPVSQPVQQTKGQVIKASDYAKANPQSVQNPNSQPTNDDIVNAIRVLQKAGLLQNGAAGLIGGQNNAYSQMPVDPKVQQMNSMLMMMNNGNNNNGMMNMMPYMNNGGKMDPQLMQMMLMNQMMPNFSSGNNNGGGY